ncbi:hypothetical protein ACS0TY_013826 [Phlomoides rotata]
MEMRSKVLTRSDLWVRSDIFNTSEPPFNKDRERRSEVLTRSDLWVRSDIFKTSELPFTKIGKRGPRSKVLTRSDLWVRSGLWVRSDIFKISEPPFTKIGKGGLRSEVLTRSDLWVRSDIFKTSEPPFTKIGKEGLMSEVLTGSDLEARHRSPVPGATSGGFFAGLLKRTSDNGTKRDRKHLERSLLGLHTSVPHLTGPSSFSFDDIMSREHPSAVGILRFTITLDERNRLLPFHEIARLARESILGRGIPMGAHTWTVVPKQWCNDYYYKFKLKCRRDVPGTPPFHKRRYTGPFESCSRFHIKI